jgi:large subunit ribosomal protein L23
MHEPYDIIDTVRLTEKATLLAEKENKYVFRVRPDANKTQIKAAIEKLFKKTVVAVNTANYGGKKKRERTAAFGRKSDWKKAIVTIKAGEKIELV